MKKKRTRAQILRREMESRIMQDIVLFTIFCISLLYALISSIVSKCCPIECETHLANLGNALNDVLTNICYSIVAGSIFYFINDLYKSVFKKVHDYNEMFSKLYFLQFNSYKLLHTLIEDKYDKNMNRQELFQCDMETLCHEKDEYTIIGSVTKSRFVHVDTISLIIDKWKEIVSMSEDFKNVYGDLLTREELYAINRYHNDLTAVLMDNISTHIMNTNQECLEILDYDISTIIKDVVVCKILLSDLAKKYINYSYSLVYMGQPYTEDFIF